VTNRSTPNTPGAGARSQVLEGFRGIAVLRLLLYQNAEHCPGDEADGAGYKPQSGRLSMTVPPAANGSPGWFRLSGHVRHRLDPASASAYPPMMPSLASPARIWAIELFDNCFESFPLHRSRLGRRQASGKDGAA
jgi:hypothetical protein